jgi:hypothetical protein
MDIVYINILPINIVYNILLAGIAQSVQQLAMDWTVQGLNPSQGKIFHMSSSALEPTHPPVKQVLGQLPVGKTANAR